MAFDFNADDIFQIAEQIEENGALFYRKASEAVTDEHYKKLLTELSAMEIDHRKIFAAMRADLAGREKGATVFDPMDESAQYLKALADLRVFHEKQIDMSSIKSVLLSALGAEKDSIVFYLGMKDLVPEKLGKEKIDAIIDEEKKHIKLIGGELLALGK